MLPIERQNYIKQVIKEKKHVKVADLSQALNVSEMTIHRDLKPIIEEGLIVKSFGGISLVKHHRLATEQTCVYCGKQNDKTHLLFRLMLSEGHVEVACCAHCGLLRYHQLKDKQIQVICYDFLRHTTINATQAFYLFDSNIDVGCCKPQILAFEWEEHAKKFMKGFSGHVHPFEQAIENVVKKMSY